MIKSKTDYKEYINCEKAKYGLRGGNQIIHFIMNSEVSLIWRFQRQLRKTEFHYNCGHKLRYVICLRKLNKLRLKTGFFIGLNTFDKGLKLMHIGHVLTNNGVSVGKNASIHIHVSLVAGGRDDGAPTIGNDCVIGVGATVLGGIKIGNGIAIGANSVVNKNFQEENIAIAGVPARKISDNGKATWNRSAKIND